MNKIIIGLILLLMFTFTSQSQEQKIKLSAEQAVSHLALQIKSSFKGQFEQKKYFPILKKPFISTGIFYSQEQQFIWQNLLPIKSTIIFEDNHLFIENSAGVRKEQQHGQQFAAIIQQILLGSFLQLNEYFTIYSASKDCLKLLSEAVEIVQIFQQIILCGQKNITSIVLYDKQNNRTEITLNYSSVEQTHLTLEH